MAAAAMVALLAACAAPSAQRSAAPVAPATTQQAPAAEAPASQATSANRVPATPTAAALAEATTAAESAIAPEPTEESQPVSPTAAPAAADAATPSTVVPPVSAPAAVPAPAEGTPVISSATQPLAPTLPSPAATGAEVSSGSGGPPPTLIPPSATFNPTPVPTEIPTEATVTVPNSTRAAALLATGTPVATLEISASTKAMTSEPYSPTSTQVISTETRIVELEWPPEMRLGDTNSVRIALIPSRVGFTLTVESPGNTTLTQTVPVERPANYDVFAVGRLDSTGFTILPAGDWPKTLLPDQAVDWRWSIAPSAAGQHQLVLVLKLRWVPADDSVGKTHEADLFSKTLTVQVASVMGMSTAQASSTGLVGLLIGSGLGLFGLAFRRAPQLKATLAQVVNPNASLKIEPHAAMQLADDETALLRTLFAKYDRVVIENEFRSGYSGARTFLVHPIHADGRADAFTIAKMGSRASIQREFDNYQRFVKDTLPPITARIQEPPVTAPALFNRDDKAVLRYTFIGEQGRMPVSLREALLADSDAGPALGGPGLLNKLFETFGPNWWMQRKPFVFRLAQEYDRMLPAHFVIEPVAANAISGARRMDGRKPAEQDTYRVGDVVALEHFPAGGIEMRADGRSLSLRGEAAAGQPPLRARWLDADLAQTRRFANGVFGRVVGTRETLLREWMTDPATTNLYGLPDPISRLPSLLNERVQGTQSTIHGDLNLENGLVGPGGFVWLIDFAETRDGHALYDFAHLEAEIIAHIIAPSEPDAGTFVAKLQADAYPLLREMHQIAGKCLFNPSQMREYWLALGMTCLGATKYGNLIDHQQHLLFLTAANLFNKL